MKKYNLCLIFTLNSSRFKNYIFYEMNSVSVLYYYKIKQKLYTTSWKNQFETKTKESVSVQVQVVVSI